MELSQNNSLLLAKSSMALILISPHLTLAAGCSSKPEVSEEDKKREAVRAQLEKIQQEYQDAQQRARSAQQQLKRVSVCKTFCDSDA